MKSKEELNALKEEVETLNKKLAKLTEEELALVNAAGDGQENIGGLVGKHTQDTVTGYNTGETDSKIHGTEFVGGLVGTAKGGTVNNCYNTGDSIGNYPKEQ